MNQTPTLPFFIRNSKLKFSLMFLASRKKLKSTATKNSKLEEES